MLGAATTLWTGLAMLPSPLARVEGNCLSYARVQGRSEWQLTVNSRQYTFRAESQACAIATNDAGFGGIGNLRRKQPVSGQ